MDGNKKLYLVKGYYWHDNGYSNDDETYDYFFGVADTLDIARQMRDEAYKAIYDEFKPEDEDLPYDATNNLIVRIEEAEVNKYYNGVSDKREEPIILYDEGIYKEFKGKEKK